MSVTKDDVLNSLAKIQTPGGVPLTLAKVLSEITATDGKVFFSMTVDAAEARAWEGIRAQAEEAVRAIPGVKTALVALTAERQPGSPSGIKPSASHRHGAGDSPMGKQKAIPGIKAIVAVASGKGGVGKSTTAINIALGLRDLGFKIGLLDADIYGPSVPRLTGVKEMPKLTDDKKMIPLQRFGLSLMSIGFLVQEETAMIWRGPMIQSAVKQMLQDVAWGELDVLVVDMPPGTGDVQLSLAQHVPLAGAVIVSTPQDLALIDARRGITMFKKVDVPTLGIVENMSYFLCPHCNTRSDIFGHGGARHEAERLGVPFLGEVPLHMSIREGSDAGQPVVETDPTGAHAEIYRAIADKIKTGLRLQAVVA